MTYLERRVEKGRESTMHDLLSRLRGDRGAAETSTIFAWIVVGVLVVFALQAGLEQLGLDVIGWVRGQLGV